MKKVTFIMLLQQLPVWHPVLHKPESEPQNRR